MEKIIFIALGGGIGSALRYGITQLATRYGASTSLMVRFWPILSGLFASASSSYSLRRRPISRRQSNSFL